MESKTQDFWAELEASSIKEHYTRSFELYEEYSKTTIAKRITISTERFEKADADEKRKLVHAVEKEVEAFRAWLEETKGLEPDSAHYHAVSLKSLLLGLPTGIQIAQLFNMILNE